MYTTAEAVLLLVRAGVYGKATVFDGDRGTVAVLLDLGVVEHHVRQERGISFEHIELTDVGRIVWREIQRDFELQLSRVRLAHDERLRLRRQRSLLPEGGRTDER